MPDWSLSIHSIPPEYNSQKCGRMLVQNFDILNML